MDPVCCMLEEPGLGRKYWYYAAEFVVRIKNRLSHSARNKTTQERFTGKLPTLHHVRIFGCEAFIYNAPTPSKFHAKTVPEIHLGVNDHGSYSVETFTDKKIQEFVLISLFDELTLPVLSHSAFSSGEEASDNSGSNRELDTTGHLYIDEGVVEIDVLDLGRT